MPDVSTLGITVVNVSLQVHFEAASVAFFCASGCGSPADSHNTAILLQESLFFFLNWQVAGLSTGNYKVRKSARDRGPGNVSNLQIQCDSDPEKDSPLLGPSISFLPCDSVERNRRKIPSAGYFPASLHPPDNCATTQAR